MTTSMKTSARSPCQVESDEQCIALWLHSLSSRSQEAYREDIARFRAQVHKPLSEVGVADLQAFMDTLADRPNLRRRATSAVKSLLGYAKRIGYLDFDPAKLVRNARPHSRISERILSGDEVRALIAAAPPGRDRLLLQTLYYAGLRVAEVCCLTWDDLREQPNGSALASIMGKGARLRVVGLPVDLWQDLKTLRDGAPGSSSVFPSRKGNGFLSRSQVLRIVQRAAKTAGIDRNVSAHWLRHSHATHAIENGAPLHLVRDTLGHANLATTSHYLHARPGESSGLYLP